MHALAEVTSETNYEVIYTVGIELICVTEFPQISKAIPQTEGPI